MINNKKIIAVIPARGGSKGIPNKNLKLFNNKPLIGHIIETLLDINIIDKVIVSSDSDSILNYCSRYKKLTCQKRDQNLADDKTTLDEVIYESVKNLTEEFDYIFTFQPTSPLIKKETIITALSSFIKSEKNSIITCVDNRHLMWTSEKNKYKPLYEKRVNRQELPPLLKENGAIIGCKKEILLKKNSRIDPNSIFLYELDEYESIDIDSYADWILAEEISKIENIGIIVIGDKKRGLGHIYRGISIANRLRTKPTFYIQKDQKIGIEKINESNYPLQKYSSEKELLELLEKDNIKIIFNDTLDTSKEYIAKLKECNRFVVTFEDLGSGSDYADISFNALYESSLTHEKNYFGYKYFDLRDEFIYEKPTKINKVVKNVLIVFGGTDPSNTTEKIIDYIKEEKYNNFNFTIVVGPGNINFENIKNKISNSKNFSLIKNTNCMSKLISNSDLMISSNGRTVYEACSLGTPLITISQNEREIMHTFGKISKTTINLGLTENLTKEYFLKEFNRVIHVFELRKRLHNNMLKINLKEGIDNIINKTFREYKSKKSLKNK